MRRWFVPLALAIALAPLGAAGCGSSANGVGTCKQIEDARCNRAPSCPDIQLMPPYYTSGSAVDACIRFYDTACLNGLAVANPSSAEVTQCLKAIQTGTCKVVEDPWDNSSACAWLIPPNTPEASVEAGDAEGGDAADAGEDGD
jgi:hypothetical protein